MGYNSYNDIASLISTLSGIDFGDAPEDGNLAYNPLFTGGNANLFPDEFSGRHGEEIPSAGEKINGNFSILLEFISSYRTFIADTVGKRSLYFDITANQVDSTLQTNQVVYLDSGTYKPYTININKTRDIYAAGLYIRRGNIHRIYTHGYVNDISSSLVPGKTYGLIGIDESTPKPLVNGYAHIINQDIIPVYRTVSTADGILIPYRPLEGVTYPY